MRSSVMKRRLWAAGVCALALFGAGAKAEGTAATPPMGFNPWNAFGTAQVFLYATESAAMLDLYARTLKWPVPNMRYELLSNAVNHGWSWGSGRQAPEVLSNLKAASESTQRPVMRCTRWAERGEYPKPGTSRVMSGRATSCPTSGALRFRDGDRRA